ncbi:O-antigen ligase family protein [Azospirillum agricola]|uniref:O-antigen ligase family protein n=1 Tax=Azospirillum agricola TaxID=1720247 RepID=UPI000A0F0900|nr:O-antigen ligase family protein [Azospirillum agricola]SMH47423.1 O-antigen ligase like membrane protein [Azospirillum lipoferum]
MSALLKTGGPPPAGPAAAVPAFRPGGAVAPGRTLTLTDSWFLFGLAADLVSMAVETVAPVKFGEFVMLAALLARAGLPADPRQRRFHAVGLALIGALALWTVLADVMAGTGADGIAKTAFRFPVLLLPIILFATAEDQLPFMKMCVGMYASKWLFFFTISLAELGGVDTGYSLNESADSFKWITPAPTACLLVAWALRPVMSRGQLRLWRFACTTSLISCAVTLSRTTLLMILLGFGWVLADRIGGRVVGRRLCTALLVAVLLALPLMPIVGTVYMPSDAIYGSDLETPSNLERTFLLETGLAILRDAPLFGVGSTAFHDFYAPWFTYLFQYEAKVDSAHNILMDIAIPFGLPAAAIFVALYGTLMRDALATARDRAITIIALWSIAIPYAFIPTAGTNRLQATLLWFVVFLLPRWTASRRPGP